MLVFSIQQMSKEWPISVGTSLRLVTRLEISNLVHSNCKYCTATWKFEKKIGKTTCKTLKMDPISWISYLESLQRLHIPVPPESSFTQGWVSFRFSLRSAIYNLNPKKIQLCDTSRVFEQDLLHHRRRLEEAWGGEHDGAQTSPNHRWKIGAGK